MNSYILVDGSQIKIQIVGEEIVIKVKASIRTDPLGQHQEIVQITNEHKINEIEQLYAQLFKRLVKEPPPPPEPAQITNQTQSKPQNQDFKANIFSSQGQNTRQAEQQAPNTGNLFGRQSQTRPHNPNQSIFSGRPSDDRQQRSTTPSWSNNIFTSARPAQNSGGNSFLSRSSFQQSSQYRSGNDTGSRINSSSSGSNLFYDGPTVNRPGPSLFSEQSSNYSSQTRRKPINLSKNKDRVN